MTVAALVHQLTTSITAGVRVGGHERLQSLPAGSVLIPTSEPDRAGMIEAICGDLHVRIFRRDLEECSVEIDGEESTVRNRRLKGSWGQKKRAEK